jgi:2-polyprenyl-3-methyl-5-hydroxy-6-metoxy-1,4-benzoquinol methylase
MRTPGLNWLAALIRTHATTVSAAPLPGRFQTYSHTLPDRYPWLFRFAADCIGAADGVRLLSFGCSRGDEVFSLRSYFPGASIKGIDIDPQNIVSCERRARREQVAEVSFALAATTQAEADESYDAIFCLAVLCRGDLTTQGVQHCDPQLTFLDFERTVADFSRCLKPSGLLVLHTTNFRFCDVTVAREFETLLEAEPAQMAPDVQFDRNNRLLPEPRYRGVVFRKRSGAA